MLHVSRFPLCYSLDPAFPHPGCTYPMLKRGDGRSFHLAGKRPLVTRGFYQATTDEALYPFLVDTLALGKYRSAYRNAYWHLGC